jgi:hypothetical protein
MNKANYSMSAIGLEGKDGDHLTGKESYYYESLKGLSVCIWNKGNFIETFIPWRKILNSAKRCGKI